MKRAPVMFALPTNRQVVFALLAIVALLVALAFAAGAALAGPRHAAALPTPYVTSDVQGTPRGDGDSVRIIVVRNPRRDPVRVVLWCRKDPRSMTAAVVPARGTVVFEMVSDAPLAACDCELAR